MRYEISLTIGAARDLAEIRAYLTEAETHERAEKVLAALQSLLATLTELPHRGNTPKELESLGRTGYRELHWQSYRAIYTIEGGIVSVIAVADGRRDMQSFLYRRLIR